MYEDRIKDIIYKVLVLSIIVTILLILRVRVFNNRSTDVTKSTECTVDTDVFEKDAPDILKTAAHVDLTDREDLELLYQDVQNDIAYYRKLDKSHSVNTGDTVFDKNDETYKVTGTDVKGFYFKDINENVLPGMSGTAILNEEGNVIGYISTKINGNIIECIWN